MSIAVHSHAKKKGSMRMIYYGIYSSPYVDGGEPYLSAVPADSLDELSVRCGTDESLVDYIGFDRDDLIDCKRAFNQCRQFVSDTQLAYMDFGNLDTESILQEDEKV